MKIICSLIRLGLVSYVRAAASTTCMSLGKEAYGNKASGTAYSDLTYL